MALVTHPSAFRLSKLAQSVGHALGLRHLTCKFSYNMKHPSAFRLRSSHKVWVALFVCGILPVNSCAIWLFVKCQMHFDCAGSHKVWAAVLACGILYVNYCAIWLVNAFDMSTCMSTAQAQARTKCGPRSWSAAFYPCKFSYMRAVQAHSDCAGSHKVWSEVMACSILSVNSCAIWLVKCNAFRLRSSHKVWVELLAFGILPVNSRAIWLLWNVKVHFDCAGSHEVWLQHFTHKFSCMRNVQAHCDCAGSHKVRGLDLRHFIC